MCKTAIICIGGGMRSAYGAGVLYELANGLNIRDVNLIIACSGSAGAALCYATKNTKQIELIKRNWTELIPSSRFISYIRFWRLIDIDYLVDDIFRAKSPNWYEALMKTDMDYRVGLVNSKIGSLHFLGQDRTTSVYELLRATMALPFYYGKDVSINGETYIDGKCGHSVQEYLDYTVSEGATKILLLDDSPPRTFLRRLLLRTYSLFFKKQLRTTVLKDLKSSQALSTPSTVALLSFRREKLPVQVVSRSKKKLASTFNLGRKDVMSKEKEIREFFEV